MIPFSQSPRLLQMSMILVLAFACFYRIAAEECPVNEHQTRCGPACEPSCARPAPEICNEDCLLPGCSCKPGFFRNSQADCVEDCSQEPCGPNMERKECGLPEGCEPLCTPVKSLKCNKRCIKNACQCKPGYIREYPGGDCISMDLCKAITRENAIGQPDTKEDVDTPK
ncbi:hypothetical protein RB195_015786 [Necator americanus]|uniref:TIL domain-containing protein n=1 Tax=Necator americanus TaxID=51031 RepID=A0ABR1E6T2_NECAM